MLVPAYRGHATYSWIGPPLRQVGAYYLRWRGADGRNHNRRVGKVRTRGEADGLTRAQAERAARTLIEKEGAKPPLVVTERPPTVDEVADAFRDRLLLEGARLSYRQNCESMQRVHVSPAFGKRRVETIETDDIERLAKAMLRKGATPKTVRNVMTFLHSVFALAVKKRWASSNPVADAARPKRRRETDADPDLQFLTPKELDAVIEAIPDHVVDRDALGPVLRLVILAAGTTGLRQSELLGLRWRDVDMRAQRVRVRNAWVRYKHSGEGKSDLSTRRSVPMTSRLTLASPPGVSRRSTAWEPAAMSSRASRNSCRTSKFKSECRGRESGWRSIQTGAPIDSSRSTTCLVRPSGSGVSGNIEAR